MFGSSSSLHYLLFIELSIKRHWITISFRIVNLFILLANVDMMTRFSTYFLNPVSLQLSATFSFSLFTSIQGRHEFLFSRFFMIFSLPCIFLFNAVNHASNIQYHSVNRQTMSRGPKGGGCLSPQQWYYKVIFSLFSLVANFVLSNQYQFIRYIYILLCITNRCGFQSIHFLSHRFRNRLGCFFFHQDFQLHVLHLDYV